MGKPPRDGQPATLSTVMRLGTPFYSKIVTSAPQAPRPFGWRRKALVLFVATLGFISFFSPQIAVDPPVIEKTRWSPWDIAWQLSQGGLPHPSLRKDCERCDRQYVVALFYMPHDLAVIYMLLALAPISLLASKSKGILTIIGLVGTMLAYESGRWGARHFKILFYGYRSPGRVSGFNALLLELLVLMIALVAIARSDDLDEAF